MLSVKTKKLAFKDTLKLSFWDHFYSTIETTKTFIKCLITQHNVDRTT